MDLSSQGTFSFTYYAGTNTNGTNLGSTAPNAAGTYTVVSHFQSGSTGYANADSSPVTFTIAKAHLLVTAANQSRLYGQANPTLTATITGFVTGENASNAGVTGSAVLSSTATATSSVTGGPYAIAVDVSGLSAVNYDFTGVNGQLTIAPVTLTVIAANQSRLYGQVNPTLTATITGFVTGESSSVVSGTANLSTTATTTSDVGSYPISAAQGTLMPPTTLSHS